jgi:Spy/CpxP family protein refolding chaperone
MKMFSFAFAAALLMLGTSSVFAQRVQVQPGVAQPIFGARDLPLLNADGLEKLKLSAEQKTKYAKIEADYKDKNKALQAQRQTDLQNLGGDRTKAKEVFEKFQADTKKAREDALAKVEPLLTAEQKTVFAQVRQQPGIIGRPPIGAVGGISQVLPPGVQQRLQLTDEQKKQVDAIQKEVEAKIMKVLNEEQRKQLEQMKKGILIRPGQPLNPGNPQIQILPVNPAPAVPARPIKRD